MVHLSASGGGESGQTQVISQATVPGHESSSEAHDVKSPESVAIVTDTNKPVSTHEEKTSEERPVSVAEDIHPSQQKDQTPKTPSHPPTSNPHTAPKSPAPSTPTHHKVCSAEPLLLELS